MAVEVVMLPLGSSLEIRCVFPPSRSSSAGEKVLVSREFCVSLTASCAFRRRLRIESKILFANRQLGAASWNKSATASSSSNEDFVILDVGARVTSMHMTMAAESAGDQAQGSLDTSSGAFFQTNIKPWMSLHADRYVAITEGTKRWLARSVGFSCSACAK